MNRRAVRNCCGPHGRAAGGAGRTIRAKGAAPIRAVARQIVRRIRAAAARTARRTALSPRRHPRSRNMGAVMPPAGWWWCRPAFHRRSHRALTAVACVDRGGKNARHRGCRPWATAARSCHPADTRGGPARFSHERWHETWHGGAPAACGRERTPLVTRARHPAGSPRRHRPGQIGEGHGRPSPHAGMSVGTAPCDRHRHPPGPRWGSTTRPHLVSGMVAAGGKGSVNTVNGPVTSLDRRPRSPQVTRWRSAYCCQPAQ